jgi:hypothetical protein
MPGIDVNPFHRRQVNHYAAIDRSASCHVVTASANRHFEAQLLRKPDRPGHICRVTALRDQRRAFGHQPVVHPSRLFVACICGRQELPEEGIAKFGRSSGNGSGYRHGALLRLNQFFACRRVLSKYKSFER